MLNAMRYQKHAAFTRIDLLVVILAAALIAGLAASSNSASSAKLTKCVGNFRQLIAAWQLYAADYDGRLIGNHHGGEAQGGAAGRDRQKNPWAGGWLDWSTARDNTNTVFLIDPKYARIAAYTGREPSLFKCPEDNYVSASQKARGWSSRARSYSMNGTVGPGNVSTGPFSSFYYPARFLFQIPNPAELYVFLEDHPDSINDPLYFPPDTTRHIEVVSNLHSGGAAFAMADGSTTFRLWKGPLAQLPVTLGPSSGLDDTSSDITWLREHSVHR